MNWLLKDPTTGRERAWRLAALLAGCVTTWQLLGWAQKAIGRTPDWRGGVVSFALEAGFCVLALFLLIHALEAWHAFRDWRRDRGESRQPNT
jgi:hypothetical protein